MPYTTSIAADQHLIAFHKWANEVADTPTSTADTLSLTLTLSSQPKPSVAPRKASHGNARCKACKVQYLRGELNAHGHCHHCADELGEAHPMNAEVQS